MNTIHVAVDFSILLHSNYHVLKKIGEPTGKGLAEMCLSSINKLVMDISLRFKRRSEIYVCTDTGDSWRKTLCVGYKSKRVPNDDFLECAYEARSIVAKDFNILEMDGMEADDWGYLMAYYKQPCVLVSNDNDWKQMVLSDDVVYFKFRTKDFYTSMDINPMYEAFEKLVLGCPGDEIPRLLPKGVRRTEVAQMYDRLETLVGPFISYTKAAKMAIADHGYTVDLKRFIINYMVANYSVDTIKKQFESKWNKIESQLRIS